jgi:hypothetical protein
MALGKVGFVKVLTYFRERNSNPEIKWRQPSVKAVHDILATDKIILEPAV